MSGDGSVKRGDTYQTGNGPGIPTASSLLHSNPRLKLCPDTTHRPENYENLQLEFSPALYRNLEQYLPPRLFNVSRDSKIQYMQDILSCYSTEGDRNRVQRHREHSQKIILSYQPLHQELYTLDPAIFFVPSFLRAITENTEESLRSIISEPSPGLYTFDMLQPHFCRMMLSEVENYEKCVKEGKFNIMRPNTMNKYGIILNDCGFNPMLTQLMYDFVRPMSKVFFPEVGGASIDSHHGFIVDYGKYRDTDLGFHVDDSEVTLNVCLGSRFSGGELYFRGVRCDKHVNSGIKPEENFDYVHVPGQALLHRGRHRHGVKATTSGHRVNLLLWCRSSAFRELRKYQKNFSDWCGECLNEKQERQRLYIAVARQNLKELLRADAEN